MRHMQDVILRGRAIRDRHNLSMRTPLREVTFVHRDPAALTALGRLAKYVEEELNVREVRTAAPAEARSATRSRSPMASCARLAACS